MGPDEDKKSHLITIKADGYSFVTNTDVLMASNYFSVYLKNEWKKGDKIEIDRDGYLFRLVLNYLRGSNNLLPREVIPELDYFQIPYDSSIIDNTIEELRAEIQELKLLIQKKCVLCQTPIKTIYNVCSQHKYKSGWDENAEINVEGKGIIKSSDVQVGNKVYSNLVSKYVKVMKIFRRVMIEPEYIVSHNNITFEVGTIVFRNLNPFTLSDNSSKEQVNIINFELENIHCVQLHKNKKYMVTVMTY